MLASEPRLKKVAIKENGEELFKVYFESQIEKDRITSIWGKEPETIEWIRDFEGPATFADVGANIGLYSLLCAAWHPTIAVLAFEPAAHNYEALIDNVRANTVNVLCLQCAVAGYMGWDNLNVVDDTRGASGSQLRYMDDKGSPLQSLRFDRQGVRVIDLDTFQGINYLKVDVDGGEFEVLQGADSVLGDPNFRSLLIEYNPGRIDMEETDAKLREFGLYPDARYNGLPMHSRNRRKGPPYNMVYSCA